MWNLMKAEIRYNWLSLLVVYFLAWAVWAAYLFDPSGSFQLYRLPAVFLAAVLLRKAAQGKRLRIQCQLPVSNRQLSLAPLALIAGLFYLGQLSIWPVQLLVAPTANRWVSLPELLTVGGLTLSLVVLAVIALDLQHHRKRRYQPLAWLVLGLGVATVIGFMFLRGFHPETAAAIADWLSGSIAISAAANLALLGMMALRAFVFSRRLRYVE